MDREVVAVVGGVITLVAALFLGLPWALNEASFPAERASIEQLRQDAQNLDPRTAEDVVGQVVAVNRQIAGNKVANTLWYADWVTPDGWDDIEPIPVPQITNE